MELSPGQHAAVFDCTHHLMIEAGAGSGKTTTLIEKILYETGLSPSGALPQVRIDIDQIVAVTFTRKATGEIKDRLRRQIMELASRASGAERELLARQAFRIDEADIGTIDAVASRIVRDFGPLAGVDSGYELLAEGETVEFRRKIAEECIRDAVAYGNEGARGLVRHFGFARARRFLTDQVFEQPELVKKLRRPSGTHSGPGAAAVMPNEIDRILGSLSEAIRAFARAALRTYGEQLIATGVLDFPHMALAAIRVIEDEAARSEVCARMRLLIVDEHQDTSPLQAKLLFRMAGLAPPGERSDPVDVPRVRLVLVGDPKQSIYAFRHADIVLWDHSRRTIELAGGHYIPLDRNYRAVPGVAAFHDIVLRGVLNESSLRPYDVSYQPLETVREPNGESPVEILLAEEPDTKLVASQVAIRVREMLADPDSCAVRDSATGTLRRLAKKDIAILSPELSDAGSFYVEALKEQGIEFRATGGTGLYERQEVQDVVALLRAVADPYDAFALAAFLRSPFAAVDDLTISELAAGTLDGSERSLFEALRDAEHLVTDALRRINASKALVLLTSLRALRDRVGHDQLIREAIARSGYAEFLAGAPDAPIGMRNLDKLIRVAGRDFTKPLYSLANQLAARVERADLEEEAPLYATGDDLVTLSTIHSAKGLEWPVVFVTEMHRHVVRKAPRRDGGPRISKELGVVLPLDVVLRSGGQSIQLPAESAFWKAFVVDQVARDYAERKRLFYVACTRARERLILCGALNEVEGPRRKLVSSPDYRTRDHYDRWLQVLLPSLTQATGETQELNQGELRAIVRRLHVGAVNVHRNADRDWPRYVDVVPETAASEWAESPRRRYESVEPGILRTEFAVSEFLQFSICPWKHFYGYRAGLSSPRVEARPNDTLVHRILPERRGEILHHYFGAHDDGWDHDKMGEELRRILLQHLPMEEEQAARSVDDLLRHVDNYLTSDVHQRVRAAQSAGRKVLREVPFLFRLAPTVSVRGVIDLLFEDEDGWTAVDYKTGLFAEEEAGQDQIVRERTQRYEVQAALYAMAAITALAPARLTRFAFFFTPPGLRSTLTVGGDWPDRFRQPALDIVKRIRSSDYGVATFKAEPCVKCEYYRRVCDPVTEDSQQDSGTGSTGL